MTTLGRRPLLLGLRLRSQTEQVTDRKNEIRAVHGVKVELGDAAVEKIEHLLGRDGRSDELAYLHILIEAFEASREPAWNARPCPCCEIRCLLEILHRQDAGHDRNVDAPVPDSVEVAKVEVVIEEEL